MIGGCTRVMFSAHVLELRARSRPPPESDPATALSQQLTLGGGAVRLAHFALCGTEQRARWRKFHGQPGFQVDDYDGWRARGKYRNVAHEVVNDGNCFVVIRHSTCTSFY